MKKLFALIPALFFAIFIQAQTHNTPISTKENNSAPKNQKDGGVSKNNGRFKLPPEKREPVAVTKFSTAPVIDGKLDDEIWKSAPVLKDFYQTSPGDNIAASKPTEVMLGYDEKKSLYRVSLF